LRDFNSRHPFWGDCKVSNLANVILQLLDQCHLEVINDGSHTHYHVQTHTSTAIDLSIVSPNILFDFQWSVVDKDQPLAYDSDHYPILLSPTSIDDRNPSKKVPQESGLGEIQFSNQYSITSNGYGYCR
jgi:hypothetical protein